MTDRELRKLSRANLLVGQMKENEQLRTILQQPEKTGE